jgi:membrane protease YdiL (CAAX protease family)
VISEKPWRPDSVLRLFLGILMTVSVGLCLAALLQSDKITLTPGHRELAQMAAMAVFSYGGSLVWIGFFLRETPMSWSEAFGLESARQRRAVRWGVAGTLLFLPAAWGLQALSGWLIELDKRHHAAQQQVVQILQQADSPWIERFFMGVLAVMIAPVVEEMLFRGILYPAIKQNGFPRAAWWVTSLVFAALHHNLPTFVPLAVFSLVLIYLYEKTGSLWASITAHSLFNFTNLVCAMLAAGGGLHNPVK